MKLGTRDFGEVEVDEGDVITFEQPIFAFEEYKKYVMLYDQGNTQIVWLQSAEDKDLCFILVDPAVVIEGYSPSLPHDLSRKIGEGPTMMWLIMVVAPNFKDSTVNLKSPIVINPQSKRAVQIISEDSLPIRYPFAKGGKGRD